MLSGRALESVTEDEQYRMYRSLIEQVAPRPVTIRTFDIDERQGARGQPSGARRPPPPRRPPAGARPPPPHRRPAGGPRSPARGAPPHAPGSPWPPSWVGQPG